MTIQHPGETKLGMKTTEKAVEGGVGRLVCCGVCRSGGVDRDGGVTGGRVGHAGGVRVGIGTRSRLYCI